MTLRDWVQDKLTRDGFNVASVGVDGLAVSAVSRPQPALIVIPEPGTDVFGAPQLHAAVDAYQSVDAIVLIRRPADEAAFAAASELGIQIDSFGNVKQALLQGENMSHYQHPDERYLRSRLGRLPGVTKISRIGLTGWAIERRGGQNSLRIITHDRYEFPVSELREVMARHPTIQPDAVVVMNPNTSGLSSLVTALAREEGVRIVLLKDFIESLRRGGI